jgi:hypothetical protein
VLPVAPLFKMGVDFGVFDAKIWVFWTRVLILTTSPNLRFHLQGIDDPNDAWEKLEVVFGKHNIIQAHQLENQLMTLSPNDFPCIEDYLSKFKTLRIFCIE